MSLLILLLFITYYEQIVAVGFFFLIFTYAACLYLYVTKHHSNVDRPDYQRPRSHSKTISGEFV
jgi:hypothetical protein